MYLCTGSLVHQQQKISWARVYAWKKICIYHETCEIMYFFFLCLLPSACLTYVTLCKVNKLPGVMPLVPRASSILFLSSSVYSCKQPFSPSTVSMQINIYTHAPHNWRCHQHYDLETSGQNPQALSCVMSFPFGDYTGASQCVAGQSSRQTDNDLSNTRLWPPSCLSHGEVWTNWL